MPDVTPGSTPGPPPGQTPDRGPGGPEFLGSERSGPGPSGPGSRLRTRSAAVVAASVAAVAVVGAGAYAAGQLMSGGSPAASAVPADAVVFVSLDLDPSAAQKMEAFSILRRFPALRSELGVGSGDDLRRTIVERLVEDGDCTGLSYADDIEPWLGERVAVAVRPSDGSDVVPLMALQVTDEERARNGVRALERCESGGSDAGVAFTGDYLVLSDTTAHAAEAAADAESASLQDDPDFTAWTSRVGVPGIVTMYVSQDAPRTIGAAEGSRRASGGDTQRLAAAFEGFEGAAGVVRFADGAVEVETATRGLPAAAAGDPPAPGVGTLPGTTAAALSVALPDGWLDDRLDTVERMVGRATVQDALRQGERATGLQLPEDLATLLGDGFDVAVDSRADLDSLVASPDPTTLPAGIRLKGDAAAITRVVERLKAAAGPGAEVLQVRSGDGVVAVGTDPDYVDSLLQRGDLGDDDAFTAVVPEADRAGSVLFVSFDAGDGWAEQVADLVSDGDPEVRRNVAPLDALGVSGWVGDDEVQHGLVRLTTD